MRSQLIKVLVAALGMFPVGCAHHVTTNAERRASFARFSDTRIGTEPIGNYVLKRSAIVFAGDQLRLRMAEPAKGTARKFSIKSSKPSSRSAFQFGLAAAIDRRGYYLTAAHNLKDDSPFLVILKSGSLQSVRARVVWRSDPDRDELDLALLAVPLRPDAVFVWAREPRPGDTAVAAGMNTGGPARFVVIPLAGEIRSVQNGSGSASRALTIRHRAPLHHGDSGGPLVTLSGGLLGINVWLQGAPLLPTLWQVGVAHRPDPAWLRHIIDDDIDDIGALRKTE